MVHMVAIAIRSAIIEALPESCMVERTSIDLIAQGSVAVRNTPKNSTLPQLMYGRVDEKDKSSSTSTEAADTEKPDAQKESSWFKQLSSKLHISWYTYRLLKNDERRRLSERIGTGVTAAQSEIRQSANTTQVAESDDDEPSFMEF